MLVQKVAMVPGCFEKNQVQKIRMLITAAKKSLRTEVKIKMDIVTTTFNFCLTAYFSRNYDRLGQVKQKP